VAGNEGVGDGSAFTVDTLLGGRVTLLQPARGFRTSLDPVLLSAFVAPPFGTAVNNAIRALSPPRTPEGPNHPAPQAVSNKVIIRK